MPVFPDMVKFLDEMRLSALKARCLERSLLANVVARNCRMSESFSHAYTSSFVRAGEALGHAELFELVQDEDSGSCTMMPYDIFSDETGAWEDPCRLPSGFTESLKDDELVKRAHARSMIQKSLRKMQDRNNIKGGTPHAGPYGSGPASGVAGKHPERSSSGSHGKGLGSSGRRRSSQQQLTVDAANRVVSLSQFNPNQHSVPLLWDQDSVENSPYGRHTPGVRSDILGKAPFSTKSRGRRRSSGDAGVGVLSNPATPLPKKSRTSPPGKTEQVDWVDVARVFQKVKIVAPSGRSHRNSSSGGHGGSDPGKKRDNAPSTSTIIAPFCRKYNDQPLERIVGDGTGGMHQEMDSEEVFDEDISDEVMLARHQVVLDEMKIKLDRFMETRPGSGRGRKKSGNASS